MYLCLWRGEADNLWRVELIYYLEGIADISGGVCLCLWRVELIFMEGSADISGG